jgi:hypothetical protein
MGIVLISGRISGSGFPAQLCLDGERAKALIRGVLFFLCTVLGVED